MPRALVAVVVAAALVGPIPAFAGDAGASGTAADGDEAPIEVTVRIEGPDATIWTGTVALDGTYSLTADTSGETYTLDARTPLGALHAAAEAGGFDLYVSDDFASTDFDVRAVAGAWEAGTWWWDYRVNWVATYYGDQHGWLTYGPGLADGDRVLWYLETTGSRPLRLTVDAAEAVPGAGSGAPGPDGVASFRVEWPLVDPFHRPGKPWPTQVWTPAHAAHLTGDVEAEAPAGVTAVPLEEGTHTTKALVRGDLWPVSTVRSNPVTVVVE